MNHNTFKKIIVLKNKYLFKVLQNNIIFNNLFKYTALR